MNRYFIFAGAVALVFLVTAVAGAAGPVGDMPMTASDTQATGMSPASDEAMDLIDWSVNAPRGSTCTPLIDTEGNVYITTLSNEIPYIKYQGTDGALMWTSGIQSIERANGIPGQGCLGGTEEDTYWYVPVRYGNTSVVSKLDADDGSILFTKVILSLTFDWDLLQAIPPNMQYSQFIMDSAGDIYFPTYDGYVRKVSEVPVPREVWQTRTGWHAGNGMGKVAMSPDETVVYNVVNAAAVTADERFKLVAINAGNGNILWSAPFGDYPPSISWDADQAKLGRPFPGGVPAVDDDGNIYFYYYHREEETPQRARNGIAKFSSAGVLQWSTPLDIGNQVCVSSNGPAGVAFSPDQSRIYSCGYRFANTRYWGIQTSDGQIMWTYARDSVPRMVPHSGTLLVGPTGLLYFSGGIDGTNLHAFEVIEDKGTSAEHKWVGPEYDENRYGGVAMDSDGNLYVTHHKNLDFKYSAGYENEGYLTKYYTSGGDLTIMAPDTLGPYEEQIPIYGAVGIGLGDQIITSGGSGTITFSIQSGSLPDGVQITSDGYIRGVPAIGSAAGSPYNVTIKAEDDIGAATKDYSITVNVPPLQTGPGLPLGAVGTPYSGGLWIIGGTPPYTVTVTAGKGDGGSGDGTLGSTGLTLQSDGTITGTPSAISSATVEVQIADNASTLWTRDITVDVVDSRVWDTFQRTTRRVGTSTLPVPVSFPHHMGDPGTDSRTFVYNSADIWTWSYEMTHAPLFALLEKDPDADGDDDGYMFIDTKTYANPSYGASRPRIIAPYDVDPGTAYPDTVANFDGWVFPGRTTYEDQCGIGRDAIQIDANGYAQKWYWSNDRQGGDAGGTYARFVCLNASDGTLRWSIIGDPAHTGTNVAFAWKSEFRGFMAINENGDLVNNAGSFYAHDYARTNTVDVWNTTYESGYPKDVASYGIYREIGGVGQVIWKSASANTTDRSGKGPLMGDLGGRAYNAAIALFKLADEGELVVTGMVYGSKFDIGRVPLRADKPNTTDPQQSQVIWTVGFGGSDYGYNDDWFWNGSRACPVVDSTNNVYVTKGYPRNFGPVAAYYRPGIWCVDAVDAAKSPPGYYDRTASYLVWPFLNSDDAVKWMTALVNADGDYHTIPATPCLSHDQRTIYTVAVARGSTSNSYPIHLNPGTKSKLFALHTINGAVKWVKDLEIGGLSGCDEYSKIDGSSDWETSGHRFAPLADSDNKVIAFTNGDGRQWWKDPGSSTNPQGAQFDGLLRPMVWCVKDNGDPAVTAQNPSVLWTRAMYRYQYAYYGGPRSFAVTPNYRLLLAGALDPEWIVPGGTGGWGGDDDDFMLGVRLIHPDDIEITDVYWDQTAGEVKITFSSQAGVTYDLVGADAAAYADGLTYTTVTSVAATGSSTTIADDLSTALTAAFRFYKVKRQGEPFYSDETVGVFELALPIGWTMQDFFISMPLVPDPDHDSVQEVLSSQINRNSPNIRQRVATTGLNNRMDYNRTTKVWSASYGSAFDIAPGEGYGLFAGGGVAQTLKVRLTGYVSEQAMSVLVQKPGWTQTDRWVAYGQPRARTLDTLGLRESVTGWNSMNTLKLRPLGASVWTTYKWDGAKWYDITAPAVDAGSTPIACGEAVVFTRFGTPIAVDQWAQSTWYYHPPNAW